MPDNPLFGKFDAVVAANLGLAVSSGRLRACRVELSEANEFVEKLHRHHDPIPGHRFTVGAELNGVLVGVAICGRPAARLTDKKNILEVTRCCTDGTRNACSFLYSQATRVAELLAFRSIQTFILLTESGASLRAVGWKIVGTTPGKPWGVPSRARTRKPKTEGPKVKYEKLLHADGVAPRRIPTVFMMTPNHPAGKEAQ